MVILRFLTKNKRMLPSKMEDEEYIQRLRTELKVIDDRGFSKYFLTMKAVADKSNEVMLTGPGRGSAAGTSLAGFAPAGLAAGGGGGWGGGPRAGRCGQAAQGRGWG